jgi:CheY-like chemotaxis protein
VLLAVSDTGLGMSAEVKEHLFEPFFTTKGVGQGTGLGLATVYGIVKQSGGDISVYSEPGQGTTFKIYLPRIKEDSELRPASPATVQIPGGWETILVVEDNDELRQLAASVLRNLGYTVLEAPNGPEAIQLFQAQPEAIHLVLTDVVMPEMSGREMVERLRQTHPGLRALYMSGYTDAAITRQGVLEPGAPFIQKPFGVEALAKKVREVLDGGKGAI